MKTPPMKGFVMNKIRYSLGYAAGFTLALVMGIIYGLKDALTQK